jgi:hypothetical protein
MTRSQPPDPDRTTEPPSRGVGLRLAAALVALAAGAAAVVIAVLLVRSALG